MIFSYDYATFLPYSFGVIVMVFKWHNLPEGEWRFAALPLVSFGRKPTLQDQMWNKYTRSGGGLAKQNGLESTVTVDVTQRGSAVNVK